MAPVIETHDLSRSFGGQPALDGVDLDVEEGEVVALLGPNGAGKTTAVRLLNGILRPDRGRCTVLGLDPVTSGTAVRRRTGVLTEAAGLDDRLTARENLALIARIRELPAAVAWRRADELLERLGMGALAGRQVHGFSTGQRRRVALALALLHDPDVLFLDEPTSGLDPAASRDVVELIAALAREQRRTVVLCTHFLADAARLCRRVAVLHRGRLQAFGTPEDLAAELWPGLAVDLDLGGPAGDELVARLAVAPGVRAVETTPDGARARVAGRDAVPALVSALAALGVPVYGAVPRRASLEDVYFALEERVARAGPGPGATVGDGAAP